MAKSQGVYKKVVYKKESGAWGELDGPAGGKELRRTSADFNGTAESYSSDEITTTMQNTDTRLGIRGADGSLNGELSPGTYSDFYGSILGKDFAAVTPGAAVEVTIAASGANFTITRSSGSFLTDGIKVGNVVRLTGAGLNIANVGNNALVISMTATVLTVKALSSTSFVAEGPIAAVTTTVVGKTTAIPISGHSNDAYNFEQFYSDIAQSEVFTGMKVGTANIQVPATGMVTTDFSFMGKGLTQTGTAAYFTTPSAPTTTGLLTSVQGALLVNGSEAACITDANVGIDRQLSEAQCLGSNFNSEIFTGKINVTGSLSAYFSDASLRDLFTSETKSSIVLVITAGEEKDADFIALTIPTVKFTNFANADAQDGIVSSLDFTAIMNNVTTSGLVQSTIMIQDSQA